MNRQLSSAPSLLLAGIALLVIGACSGDADPHNSPANGEHPDGQGGHPPASSSSVSTSDSGSGSGSGTDTGSGSGSGSGSSTGSGEGGGPVDPPPPPHLWTECQSTDQAFVRRTILALNGRRPLGQAEVNAYEDVLKGIRNARDPGRPEAPEDIEIAKRLVALSMMREDAFRERWSDFLMDALHVVRIETKSLEDCYGPVISSDVDDGSLAAWVRDNGAEALNPPIPNFTMGKLLRSAIELDDLSVVYRAHLFAMMYRPLDGANVDFYALERSRRQDFGAIFDAAYIHRDVVCLGCHNSEYSVTQHDDPAKNRAWPVPGLFEIAIYGASNGQHPGEEDTKGTDFLRAHSPLRVTGVVGGSKRPYGWSFQCGSFSIPTSNDPLNIDSFFGSIRSTPADPTKGLRASVWDLEHALHRGVDQLAEHGLTRLPGNQLADADEAFAYLVAENIVEKVWEEVVGSRLTIANYFPRTEVQRDILMSLTEHFVASHFSLKTLLVDILAHPVFNLKAPEEGCGDAAYELPPILDPWTRSDGDPKRRPNSPADGVFAISSRPLLRSLHRAMEWPFVPDYPLTSKDEAFQSAVGLFIKDATPGYRGLDFQGRLTWEQAYGACAAKGSNDFIAKIKAKADATPGTTLGEALIALKDRLTGEPWIDPDVEQPDLEALLGASLSSTDLSSLDAKLRAACGVLVSTPQFMLGGLIPKDIRDVPKLTPPDVSYQLTCKTIARILSATHQITCDGEVVVVKK
jgi:hypothetical protein